MCLMTGYLSFNARTYLITTAGTRVEVGTSLEPSHRDMEYAVRMSHKPGQARWASGNLGAQGKRYLLQDHLIERPRNHDNSRLVAK